MKSQVNVSGTSQQNNAAAFSSITEVHGDLFWPDKLSAAIFSFLGVFFCLVFFFFYILKQVPIYFSRSGECCRSVLLWRSTNVCGLRDFSSTAANDRIFLFGWTYPKSYVKVKRPFLWFSPVGTCMLTQLSGVQTADILCPTSSIWCYFHIQY